MKAAFNNGRSGGGRLTAVAAGLVVLMAVALMMVAPPHACADAQDSGTGIHIWIVDSGRIHGSFDEVIVGVQALKSCYATVFVVDTYGFLHVVHPFSPIENSWITGGITHVFGLSDVGLGSLYGRGIAYVFAIGSPVAFDFTDYGESLFAGRFGFRIYGDPFLACRELYSSLLPTMPARGRIGVAFATFYVKEWTRYPAYLFHGCHDSEVHVRVGERCERCRSIYEQYRTHTNDPYAVFGSNSEVARTRNDWSRVRKTRGSNEYRMVMERAARRSAQRANREVKIVSAGTTKSETRLVRND